jgi:Leucine-rich repeat (LRR) protein
LNCQNNKFNSLIIDGCCNLSKIDCSSNYIRELDLSSCANLDEVDISNCPELTTDAIKSDLTHDTISGKLVRNGSQITQAKENDIRNILVVG